MKNKQSLEDLLNEVDRLNRKEGFCLSLIYDDFGHWALVGDGVQKCNPKPDITTFTIDSIKDWKSTIREAIEYTLKKIHK